MTIQRVHPMSFAKVSAFVYAFMGLIIGAFCALFALAGTGVGKGMPFGAFFGVGAIIILPILYGVIGFIGSLIGAAIYNFAANVVGGIVFDAQ